jgi:exopolysaccharide biosynthesis polyprenyl glycosylphosphotransferase
MLREQSRQLYRMWIAIDAATAAVVFMGLAMLPEMRGPESLSEAGIARFTLLGLIVILGWPLLLSRFRVYQSQRRESMGAVITGLTGANALGALIVSTVALLLSVPVSPAFPLALAAGVCVAQAALRVPIFYALHALRRAGRNYRNVLIVGAGPRAREAMQTIDRHPEWGLRIVGFLDDGGEPNFVPSVPLEQIHKFIDLPELLREETIDEVLVACPRTILGSLASVVSECALIGVPVTLLTDIFGDDLPPPRAGRFDSLGTLSFAPVHHGEIELAVKRAIDIVGATAGLLISAPIIAVAALAIRIDSKGPVFFTQVRCGRNGRRFDMPKLRTMDVDAESRKIELMHLNEMDGPVFKIRDDPRITRVGHFLRTWSLDELPQFFSVLVGDMSLVGPRPPTPDEVAQYNGSERRRLSMRPGLTCRWQVNGRNDVCFEEWMKLDLEYIDEWSLTEDFRILAKTIPQVVLARGAR